jgi:hypothetical protein
MCVRYNILKTFDRVKNVLKLSSCITEYILHLHYKDEPLNAV